MLRMLTQYPTLLKPGRPTAQLARDGMVTQPTPRRSYFTEPTVHHWGCCCKNTQQASDSSAAPRSGQALTEHKKVSQLTTEKGVDCQASSSGPDAAVVRLRSTSKRRMLPCDVQHCQLTSSVLRLCSAPSPGHWL